MDIKGKKILILGGTAATLDLVKNAKSMGLYTVVTDYLKGGAAKEIADETADVSTTDIEGLKKLITERNIDGVFCGPSEFNIRNLIRLCEETGLHCYTDMALWDKCANKDEFKQFCIDYGVDCPKKFDVDENSSDEEIENLDYPVIVKPVDGNSSHGITVCKDKSTLREACRFAMENSTCKRIVVEKYIDNGGELFGARYIIKDGEAYPYLLIDTYIADPIEKKSLISHFSPTPSKYTDYYMKNMDQSVRNMLKGMGIKNGTAFFQALPYNGKIYFHEMGYRLSGGMLFKLTEPLMGINDMMMMIRFSMGGEMCTEEEKNNLDVHCSGKFGGQLTVPLCIGEIASIEGLEESKNDANIVDFIQYYTVGDKITEEKIGTLAQHFGRFTIIADSLQSINNTIKSINEKLVIRDTNGNIMNSIKFDINRTLI